MAGKCPQVSSSCVVLVEMQLTDVEWDPLYISSLVCCKHISYFEPKSDLFWSLVKWFLCLNPNQSISTEIEPKKMLISSTYLVGKDVAMKQLA